MENELWKKLLQLITYHKGKVTGVLLGFFLAILILIIGFFKALLVVVFSFVGYYLGSRWDQEGDFKRVLDRLLPPQYKQ
ncbi:DUF2273 domain-containing protein [Iocasia frigidifontis]|uniref:DUF2273 domain-containing protein n=1 Tax=Iocasia fonsfrigidae TaxID=2682810 RepID=A0A8A7KEK3_9FIRM|nr:DUF2273 domain-containing protein [Iocasia fonsfrigidae]QTL98525.1 DUF2273 domain-containing protein [Iocasia fonsfrigidae]